MYVRKNLCLILALIIVLSCGSTSYAYLEPDTAAKAELKKEYALLTKLNSLKDEYYTNRDREADSGNPTWGQDITSLYVIDDKYILLWAEFDYSDSVKLYGYVDGKFVDLNVFDDVDSPAFDYVNFFRSEKKFTFKYDEKGKIVVYVYQYSYYGNPTEVHSIAKFTEISENKFKYDGSASRTKEPKDDETLEFVVVDEDPNYVDFEHEMNDYTGQYPYFREVAYEDQDGTKHFESFEEYDKAKINEALYNPSAESTSDYFKGCSEQDIRNLKYSIFIASQNLTDDYMYFFVTEKPKELFATFMYYLSELYKDLHGSTVPYSKDISYKMEDHLLQSSTVSAASVRESLKDLFNFDLKDFNSSYDDVSYGINNDTAYYKVPYWAYEEPFTDIDIFFMDVEQRYNYGVVKCYELSKTMPMDQPYRYFKTYYVLLKKESIEGEVKIYPVFLSDTPFTAEQAEVNLGVRMKPAYFDSFDMSTVDKDISNAESDNEKETSYLPFILLGSAALLMLISLFIFKRVNKKKS